MSEKSFNKKARTFFSNVSELTNSGLQINDNLKVWLNTKYYNISKDFETDNVSVFEERIQDIFTELMEDCPPPIFWKTPIDKYLDRKWR